VEADCLKCAAHLRGILAVWLSGNALVSISEITIRWAQLLLGWVPVFGQVNRLGM